MNEIEELLFLEWHANELHVTVNSTSLLIEKRFHFH